MQLHPLTPEEQRVILNKGTEAPFSGEYEKFNQQGIFTCRQCHAPLYRSEDKFDAHCGWPSFDQEILGAVTRSTDADGRRTEITCSRCHAHLGHVFTGEELTPKDTRHCVNSLSLKFQPQNTLITTSSAYFGGGCFWCTEATFLMIKGVISVTSGYAGGTTINPTYEQICTGRTGHAEITKIDFDQTQISYEALLEIFFSSHNPTTLNQQGNDHGTQYRSIILTTDELQKELATNFIKKITQDEIFTSPITTEIIPLEHFYPAESYHQNYYANNPEQAYCQMVISPKIHKLTSKLSSYLKST